MFDRVAAVLILIVLEDALGVKAKTLLLSKIQCLNPYCVGGCSWGATLLDKIQK